MTTVEINAAFMAHRKNCAICASEGLGLCWVGVKLIKLFHDVIVEEIVKDLPKERATV
jgi:hypothetical protein